MESKETVKAKSYAFAKRCIKLYQFLCEDKKEFIVSKQLLRSGTSIGANIVEAGCAVSRKEFLAKMYIAFKECAETTYWLELLCDCTYLTHKEFNSIHKDCEEIQKMLSSITKTTKNSFSPTPHS